MIVRHPRRVLTSVRVLLGLVVAGSLVQASPVEASGITGSEASALGGYQGTAAASGLHLFYNPEGVLPIGAPVDAGAPDALATIASGPSTFARSSVLDPGDLVANPDVVFALGVSGWKAGTIPPYPYRASASSGAGAPTDESSPSPGLEARASADTRGSAATATMPATSTPGLASFGSMLSSATTATDGSRVTVHARSEMSDVNVLGIVTMGSVVTDLTATSDGTTTTVTGGTTVTDAAVLGTPVTIDADGIHQAPGSTAPTDPLNSVLGSATKPVLGNLNDTLAAAGIHITVAGAAPQGTGSAGQITSNGLRIDVEVSDRTLPVLKTLVGTVPYVPNPLPGAPSVADVLVFVQARHLFAIELGRGHVVLSARPSRPVTFAPTGGVAVTPIAGSASTGAVGSAARPVAASAQPSLVAAAPARATGPAPEVPVGAGIGALVLLALLAQPFIGDRIARASSALLATDDHGSCPWEGA